MTRLFQFAFWAALIFAFVMALLPHPPQLPGEPTDKVQHMLAFATLTALALPAYPARAWWQIGVALAGFGALIEFCQLIPALGREGSWLDWLADCGAVAIVLAIGAPLRVSLRKRSSPRP